MEKFMNASEVYPGYFQGGELWHCGDDFYLIEHPYFQPQTIISQTEKTCFFVVTKGWINAFVDGSPIKLLPGMSVNIMPRESVSVTSCSEDMDAVVYILSKKISEMIFIKKGFAIYTEMRKNPVVVHNDYSMRVILDIVNMLRDTLEHPHANNMVDVCATLLNLYFRLAAPGDLHRDKTDYMQQTRYEQIMTRFTSLLEKFYQQERGVKFYADQLCVTPKYLSACTKHVTGHTANWWINSYVLRDATQMLVHSNLSVKVISTRLGFDDQMLFGKYFRRQMGVSPTEYKKREQKRLTTQA